RQPEYAPESEARPKATGNITARQKTATAHRGRTRKRGNPHRSQNRDPTLLMATADPKDEYQRFGGNLSYCFTGAWDLSEHCRALIRRPNYWVEKATAAHATHPKCYEFQRYLG